MHASISAKNQEVRKKELEQEIEKLQAQLGEGVDAGAIVKRHIYLLHKYNEAKDATQVLIGRVCLRDNMAANYGLMEDDQLATIKGTTIRQIHEDYDLRNDD